MDDLFFVPCFGPQQIRNESFAILTEQLRNRWIEAYPNSKSLAKFSKINDFYLLKKQISELWQNNLFELKLFRISILIISI